MIALLIALASAGTPQYVTHTGRVLDAQGSPTNGTQSLSFRLYDSETGGTLVFDQTVENVPVQQGYFSVRLGPLPESALAGAPLHIEYDVGSLFTTSRQALSSVPYALQARVADSIPVSVSGVDGTCDQEGRVVWDRAVGAIRICDENMTWATAGSGGGGGSTIGSGPNPLAGGRFEHVATMYANGTFADGDWADIQARVRTDLSDCVLRFDDRMQSPAYIEASDTSIRFDFQPLHAYHNAYDAYAFIELTPGTRAGLGTSYRRGAGANVHLPSDSQHSIVGFTPMTVDLLCEATPSYVHTASFNSAGEATFGSFDALQDAAVDRGAECKVSWNDRIHTAPHVESGPGSLLFDFIGLHASHNTWDAYAYISIDDHIRAGYGSSYRRGLSSTVHLKDRTQHSETAFVGADVDVYCRDTYSEKWTILADGSMQTGDWSSLHSAVTDDLRDCRVGFDDRVTHPDYIEYGAGTIDFNFADLTAYHDSWDAFALVRLSNNNFARLDRSYRRGRYGEVQLKTSAQHQGDTGSTMTVNVFCAPAAHSATLAMTSTGATSDDWASFYQGLQETEVAPDCKIRWDGRIVEPVLMERTPEGFFFNQQGLAGMHNSWNAYSSIVMEAGQTTGQRGNYRRGNADQVGLRDEVQHTPTSITPADVELFCR